MKLKAILIIAIALICVFVVIFLLTRISKANNYSIGKTGHIYKDKDGVISTEFKEDLENPRYDPRNPAISYYSFASGKNHHTHKYFGGANSVFVIRRGYPFVIIIDPEYRQHDPTLEIDIDMNGFPLIISRRVSKTAGKIDLTEMFEDSRNMKFSDPNRYINKYYTTTKISSDEIFPVKRTSNYIIFNSSPNASIGKYLLDGFPSKHGGTSTLEVNLICNPYHPQDDIYMSDQELLKEYIDNEYGLNFQGTSDNKTLSSWHYDQFDTDNLLAGIKLIQFLSNAKGFDPADPVNLMRHFTFGLNSEVIAGLWPTNITIFRKPDGLPSAVEGLPDNFNDPFTACVSNDECVKVFQDYKINKLRIQDPLCSSYTNAPSGTNYTFPKLCALNPKNPFRAPFVPKENNTPFYKTCTSTSECEDTLRDWDGSNNKNDFPPLSEIERKGFDPSCMKQSVCTVDAWNGGTPPGYWFGSTEILKTYKDTKKMARWAECWVYAGVMTTVCRSFGMPCRQISAYEVARQFCAKLPGGEDQCKTGMGKFNATVNVTIDDNGKATYADDIYMWSFHAWNNVWSRRKDLKNTAYTGSGWQVIDATPQELSFGVLQMGPVPLKAIKNMDMDVNFDSRFVNTEVNYTLVLNNKEKQGSKATIFTNKIGLDFTNYRKLYYAPNSEVLQSLTMQDITNEYVKSSRQSVSMAAAPGQKVFVVKIAAPGVNSPITINASISSSLSGTAEISGSFQPILYIGKDTGPAQEFIKKTMTIQSNRVLNFNFQVPIEKLDLHNTNYFRFGFTVVFPDGSKKFETQNIYVHLPPVKLREISSRGNERTVEITYQNPYKDTILENSRLELYTGSLYNKTINIGDIAPQKTLTFTQKIKLSKNSILTAKLYTSNFSRPSFGSIFV